MGVCKEIGEWITDHVTTPVEQFFNKAEEACHEARTWVEQHISKPIESWRSEQEKRCREEKCYWACLCCNKLICWFVTIWVRVVEWVVEIVGEWLVEIICMIVVTVIKVIVMVVLEILKWVVLLIVCLVEALCAAFILAAALALLAMLLTLVALGSLAQLPVVVAFALAALALARLLCGDDWCRIVGAIGWALKWAIVLGAGYAIGHASGASALIVVTYGGLLAALIILLEKGKCKLPSMLSLP